VTRFDLRVDLTGRRVVVVGGGRRAAPVVRDLVLAGAHVHVIAPEVIDEISRETVALHLRRYAPGDLCGAWLAAAVTGEPTVDAAVEAEAATARVWCLPAPRTPIPGDGFVALVGAGPGDPGLITVRGRELLDAADVVVVDRLAPAELVSGLPARVEVVDAGKAPHRHNLSQDDLNALLVDRARRGLRVVRLKGGDPFVFGRGGEEALACARAGVRFEVVPGVTSAVAVPAYAGIPVTHRGITQDFAVVSAHLDPSKPGASVDWAALAAGPGTLVLLMAVAVLEEVTRELVKRGRSAYTPAAVICSGTTPAERVVTGELGTIAELAAAEAVTSPAVVVIGDVVRLRDEIAWR